MPALRLGVVYFRGMYHVIGPVTRRSIYAHAERARAEAVRELLARFAGDLLDADLPSADVFAPET